MLFVSQVWLRLVTWCITLYSIVSYSYSWRLQGKALARFAEVACHCLFPRAERKRLAQSHLVGSVPEVVLELRVFPVSNLVS